MLRAVGLGLGILAAGQAVGIAILSTGTPVGESVGKWLVSGASVVAAYVTARAAPRWKVVLGLLMAVPASALSVGLNIASEWLGQGTDFPGVQGNVFISKFLLWWNGLLCAIGASEGSYPAAKLKLWSWMTKSGR